jgi:hypothetical protein
MQRGSVLALLFVLLVPLLAGCPSAPVVQTPDAQAVVDLGLAPPVTLAPAQTTTSCLAVDANAVYWTDQGSGNRVMKVALAGGAPQVLATGGDKPGCVAIDQTNAYYTDGGSATLMKVPLAGGAPAALAQNQHVLPERKPLLASDGSFVYFITDVYGDVDAYNNKNAIVRVPVTGGGGPVEVLVAEVIGDPAGLAVDAANVYFSDSTGVYAQPKSGAAPLAIPAMSTIHSNSFATDGVNLVIAEVSAIGQGDLALFRTDGNGRTVLSSTLASSLAIDSSGVYAKMNNALVRFKLDGSGMATLASSAPRAIALDSANIYFTDGASILKLSK